MVVSFWASRFLVVFTLAMSGAASIATPVGRPWTRGLNTTTPDNELVMGSKLSAARPNGAVRATSIVRIVSVQDMDPPFLPVLIISRLAAAFA